MRDFEFESDDPAAEIDLESAVYQALGYASVCWDDDGVFMDREITDCAEKLLALIQRRINSAVAAERILSKVVDPSETTPVFEEVRNKIAGVRVPPLPIARPIPQPDERSE